MDPVAVGASQFSKFSCLGRDTRTYRSGGLGVVASGARVISMVVLGNIRRGGWLWCVRDGCGGASGAVELCGGRRWVPLLLSERVKA